MSSDVASTSLLPAIARGDVKSFEALYDRTSASVYALLLRMHTTPEDAQEALQRTFIQAWTDASAYDASKGSELNWLMSIARRNAANEDAKSEAALDPVAPAASVRDAILDELHGQTTVRSMSSKTHAIDNRWWLATAAVLFLALWGWRELAVRAARETLDARDAEIRRLAAANDLLARRGERLNAETHVLASHDTKILMLAGQPASPNASARAFLDTSKRRAVVFLTNFPANPPDKSYQLWIVRGDHPQSGGVFDITAAGSASIFVENVPAENEITGMAVTLEPRGGVADPTNTNFYVLGKT